MKTQKNLMKIQKIVLDKLNSSWNFPMIALDNYLMKNKVSGERNRKKKVVQLSIVVYT